MFYFDDVVSVYVYLMVRRLQHHQPDQHRLHRLKARAKTAFIYYNQTIVHKNHIYLMLQLDTFFY